MSSIQAHLRSHNNEETLIGHMDGVEGLLTDIKGYVDAVETKLETIATNTSNINVNVGDVEVNVADMEALQTTTNTKLNGGLPSALTGSGNLKVSVEEGSAGGDASASNQVVLEASLTAMEGKQDALISANHTDLVALEASLTAMEGKQDALISANHTDLVALEATLTSQETARTKVATQLLYGTGNLVANNADESSTNNVEFKNNGSDYFSIFITAENTTWEGYLEYSYDGTTWFTDVNVNSSYNSTYNANLFKHGKYVRVKIGNSTAGTPGDTNAFVVHIVQ